MFEFIKGNIDNLEGKVLVFAPNEYGDSFYFNRKYFFPSIGATVKRIFGIKAEVESFNTELSVDFRDEAQNYNGDVIKGPNIVSRPNGKAKEGVILAYKTISPIVDLYIATYVN